MSNEAIRGAMSILSSFKQSYWKRLGVVLVGLLGTGAMGVYWSAWAEKAVLRAGYNRFPPYVYTDESGKPVGFAVDVINRAAKKANVSVRWVYIPGGAEAAWARNEIDLYPLLTITPLREQTTHLSPAWWEGELAMVSLRAKPVRSPLETEGRKIATRLGYVQQLSARLFPRATLIAEPASQKVLETLCAGTADGFFVDSRVLLTELLDGTDDCRRGGFSVVSVPDGRIAMGTASTQQTAKIADRIYEQIAQFALDGTLSQIASRWGLFGPYQTGQMKAMVDEHRRADLTRWGGGIAVLIVSAFYLQLLKIRRAHRNAEAAYAEAEQGRAQLFYQANHDALTGLPNRRFFERRLREEMVKSAGENLSMALFYFDLDGFKSVNDTLGHEAGDNLLIAVSARLRTAFSGDNLTIARMGGDEFAFFASNRASESDPSAIAGRLLNVLREPFDLCGQRICVSASIGVSLFPRDSGDAQELSRNADSATYEAKRLGKNTVRFFVPEPAAAVADPGSAKLACPVY